MSDILILKKECKPRPQYCYHKPLDAYRSYDTGALTRCPNCQEILRLSVWNTGGDGYSPNNYGWVSASWRQRRRYIKAERKREEVARWKTVMTNAKSRD